jgi:hypothetical protein
LYEIEIVIARSGTTKQSRGHESLCVSWIASLRSR